MGKAETVAKYIEEFLREKKPEFAEKFRNKDVNKQYASIMGWRRKLKHIEETPKSNDDILAQIQQAKSLIMNASEISAQEAKLIGEQIAELQNALAYSLEQQRIRTIQDLERKQQEIARQLQILKGEEPDLFGSQL